MIENYNRKKCVEFYTYISRHDIWVPHHCFTLANRGTRTGDNKPCRKKGPVPCTEAQ